MNDTDFLALLMRHQDGALSPDEIAALEAAMRADASKRRLFAETQLRSLALHERFRHEAFQSPAGIAHFPPPKRQRLAWIPRPIAAMAAGLVIGLFSASLVWAVASPRATTARLFSLLNGSFEENRIGHGFPRQTGLWSGDEAEVVEKGAADAKDGKRALHFIRPEADEGDPAGRAISCDVFQLVDLRPLRAQFSPHGESLLELNASFLDSRPSNTNPSITFFCQLYVFNGDPALMHRSWPQSLPEALSSGSAQITTLGGEQWRTLAAKCLIPAAADFAVVQIAARPNLRPAKLDGLFADDVRLTLKTSPALPVRTVHR